MRTDKHSYYLGIAEAVLKRSTCLRRKYGAVIVKDDEIISTGYNGAPRGEHEGIPHGERYEACRSVHGEANAIISASRRDMIGATLYLAGRDADGSQVVHTEPCAMCKRLIINAGIKEVITQSGIVNVNDWKG